MSKTIPIRRKTRSSNRNKNEANRSETLDKPIKKRYGSNGLWAMRTDHSKTFKDKTGETTPLKTGAVIIDEAITLANPLLLPEVKGLYNEKIKEKPSNRPVIVNKLSKNGIPIEGYTPTKKTPMYSEFNSGALAYFYNRPPREGHDNSPPLKKNFHKSIEYKRAPEVTEPVKEQFFSLHKHSHFSKKSRVPNPMKISADDYCIAAGYSSPSKRKKRGSKALTKRTEWDNGMEWNHLKDHASFGDSTPKNLGAARFSTNTRMIPHATTQRKLALKYGKALVHVQCTLKTDVKKQTHIFHLVRCGITVKGVMNINHLFKNTRANPHVSEEKYSNALVSALMEIIPKPSKSISPKKSESLTSREEYLEATDNLTKSSVKKKLTF